MESATSMPEGTILNGWVIKKASNGVPRWMPVVSATLNGFRRFTVDYAAKHIGQPITLYCRDYMDMWPKKNAWTKPANPSYMKMKFVPNGDAIKGKTRVSGWLTTQKPVIKKGMHFAIDGPLYESGGAYFADSLQVDSAGGQLASTNLMSDEVFVKA
jgi:hypothetical protein